MLVVEEGRRLLAMVGIVGRVEGSQMMNSRDCFSSQA